MQATLIANAVADLRCWVDSRLLAHSVELLLDRQGMAAASAAGARDLRPRAASAAGQATPDPARSIERVFSGMRPTPYRAGLRQCYHVDVTSDDAAQSFGFQVTAPRGFADPAGFSIHTEYTVDGDAPSAC